MNDAKKWTPEEYLEWTNERCFWWQYPNDKTPCPATTTIQEEAKNRVEESRAFVGQIDRLADFLMAEFGSNLRDERAVDCAIRLLEKHKDLLEEIKGILAGVLREER